MANLTPEEWHRRFTQQAHWTASLRRHLFEQLNLSSTARVLEVGCGTGAILNEMNAVSYFDYTQDADLYGLDINLSSLRLCAQNAPAAFLAQGDAHRLPYAPASFEAVFCHFLLLWVDDPVQVVAEMKRVACPGAAVLALAEPDYGGRIDYPEELAQLGRWQQAALSDQGADPLLGRKLAAIFHQAGLKNIQSGVLGGQWRMDDPADESEWQVLQDDLGDSISAVQLAELRRLDLAARRNGERILFVPTFYALGWVN